MKDQYEKFEGDQEIADKPQLEGRRKLLKGAATALPAILTLHSGAVLARSSNLISTTPYKTPDRAGRTHCLDLQSVRPVGGRSGSVYDLGPNGRAEIYRISERNYYVQNKDGQWQEMDEAALCERGGIRRGEIAAYEDSGGMQQIEMPRLRRGGGMMSATAYSSITDRVIVHDL